MKTGRFIPAVAILLAGVASFTTATAATSGSTATDDWQYNASIYLWGAGIKGTTRSGAEVDASFDTLFRDLNMGFMGSFEARKTQWSFLADVVYMSVGDSDSGTIPVSIGPEITLPVEVDASVGVKGLILSLLGGYRLYQTDKAALDLVAGARYLDIETNFKAKFTLEGQTKPESISEDGSVWDAVVGIRGHADLNERWFVPYHFDVGTGQSDLTWQAAGGVGYSFDWGDASLLYRHMEWDFGNKSAIKDIKFSGPLLSAKFYF